LIGQSKQGIPNIPNLALVNL